MSGYSGTVFEFRDSTIASAPEFRIVLTQCEAGLFLAQHEHCHSFLSFLMNGVYREGLGKSWSDCGENSITWHPQGDAHEVQHGPSVVTSLQIEFPDNRLDGNRLRQILPHRRRSAFMPGARPLLGFILNEAQQGDELSSLAVKGYVLQLLAQLGRVNFHSKATSLVAMVNNAMRESFPNAPDVEALALRLGCPVAEIARQYRLQTGFSLAARLRKMRISRACELLAEGDRPLSDIAMECGYFDQSHFTRAFSQSLHCTPGQYRKLIHQ